MNVFLAPRFRADYEKRPLTLVDVGASGGMQAHWKIASPHLRFIGFEPDEREFENLRKKSDSRKAVYLNTALYDHAGEIELRLLKHQQVSSVFEPNQRIVSRFPDSDWFEEVRRVRVRVNTLDAELKANQIDDVDFVKLDVQGSGLAILKGADGLLRRSVFGLELEVEFLEIYKGQPLFADVDAFVKPYGFELFDLNGSYWKRTKGARLAAAVGSSVSPMPCISARWRASSKRFDCSRRRRSGARRCCAPSPRPSFSATPITRSKSRTRRGNGCQPKTLQRSKGPCSRYAGPRSHWPACPARGG